MTSPSHALPAASAPASSSSLYDDQVGEALNRLVTRFGAGLLGEPGRLRGLLQDECPQAKRETSVLLLALEERVPQDLTRVQSGEPIQSLSPRLAKRLVEEKSLSPAAAQWAVDAWARGLGLTDSLVHSGVEGATPSGTVPPLGPGRAGPANDERARSDLNDAVPPTGWAAQPPAVRYAVMGLALVVLAAALWFGLLQPKAQIVGVDTQGPLVADGRPNPVLLDIETRRTAVQRVDVRFVRGDVTWPQAAWSVTPEGGAVAAGKVAVGTLAQRADKPVSATFEYTLVATDGTRSAPFEHSFTFVPPAVITGVRVPRPLLVGREFALSIQYKRGGADIVQIERRIVDAGATNGQAAISVPVQLDQASGAYEYRFDAAKQPTRSAVEFVLVDAQGVRSQPYKVNLDIGTAARAGSGPATVVAIREIKGEGKATGVGAVVGAVGGAIVGHLFGKGSGKDAATVVGAGAGGYAGHQIEKGMRSTVGYETTVRFDDGTTRVVRHTQAPTWAVGQRVELENGNIVR